MTLSHYTTGHYTRPVDTTLRIGARVQIKGTRTHGTIRHLTLSGRAELSTAWVRLDSGKEFSSSVQNLLVGG